MELVVPAAEHLASYRDALVRRWSPENSRDASTDELRALDADPVAFVASLDDRDAAGPPIVLADNTTAPRLPGFHRWMWDGEFCGFVGVRWQPGTTALPPHCLGHIGYSVVPWKRRRGYATEALRLILPAVQQLGLPYVELATHDSNVTSQRVILANGGSVVEKFIGPPSSGGEPMLRWRLPLDA